MLSAILVCIFVFIYSLIIALEDSKIDIKFKFKPKKEAASAKQLLMMIKATAKKLGLKFSQANSFLLSVRLHGKYHGFDINSSMVLLDARTCMKIHIDYNLAEAQSWYITTENAISSVQGSIGIKDIQVGDGLFDQTFLLKAKNPDYLVSFLNHTVRKHLLELQSLSERIEVRQDSLELIVSLDKLRHARNVISLFNKITQLPVLLSSPSSFKNRLMNIVQTDREKEIRLKNLTILYNEYREDPETKDLFNMLLNSEDMDLKIYAAKILQEEGFPVLMGLIKSRQINSRQILDILDYFKKKNYSESIPVLLTYFPEASNVDEKISIIQVLGACGGEEILSFLNELGENTKDAQLRNEIYNTIAMIKKHHGIQEKTGWLSMDMQSGSQGGLRLPDGKEGGLSMEEEE